MSYILDALKKSDQERKRGTIPDLNTLTPPPPQKSGNHSFWSCLLAIALFLNAGLLLWWIRPWQQEPPPTALQNTMPQEAPPPAISENPAAPAAPAAPMKIAEVAPGSVPQKSAPPETKFQEAGPMTVPVADQPFSTPPEAEPSTITPLTQTALKPVPSEAPSPKTTPAPGTPPMLGKSIKSESLQSSTSPQRTPQQEAPGKAIASSASPTPSASTRDPGAQRGQDFREIISTHLGVEIDRVERAMQERSAEDLTAGASSFSQPVPHPASPDAASSGSQFDAEPVDGVPLLKDLPAALRGELPKLTFSGYVYSKNESDRMVIINGRVRREGDEVQAGLRLEAISPRGAIFNFRGTRFMKGL